MNKSILTLRGPSLRKHALQLQLYRQTGQASAMSSSEVLGYLQMKIKEGRRKKEEVSNLASEHSNNNNIFCYIMTATKTTNVERKIRQEPAIAQDVLLPHHFKYYDSYSRENPILGD